jgi:hypothetical protein
MKAPLQPARRWAFRFHRTSLAVLAACLAAGMVITDAAPLSVRPLVYPGKWSDRPQGEAFDVAVAGNYAYLADGSGGLQVLDISDPAHPARVGGYTNGGLIGTIAVSGNCAYVAGGSAGLQGA